MESIELQISKGFCMIILRKLGNCLIIIAVIFQCTRQTVSKWCKSFEKDSLAGLGDLQRIGRPKKVPNSLVSRLEDTILSMMNNEKNVLCQSAIFLFKKFFSDQLIEVSRSTIYRFFYFTNLMDCV